MGFAVGFLVGSAVGFLLGACKSIVKQENRTSKQKATRNNKLCCTKRSYIGRWNSFSFDSWSYSWLHGWILVLHGIGQGQVSTEQQSMTDTHANNTYTGGLCGGFLAGLRLLRRFKCWSEDIARFVLAVLASSLLVT